MMTKIQKQVLITVIMILIIYVIVRVLTKWVSFGRNNSVLTDTLYMGGFLALAGIAFIYMKERGKYASSESIASNVSKDMLGIPRDISQDYTTVPTLIKTRFR